MPKIDRGFQKLYLPLQNLSKNAILGTPLRTDMEPENATQKGPKPPIFGVTC